MSGQIYVSISICVFGGDVGLCLLWRRMATCPCIWQLHSKLRCKWWPRCWRPTRLVPARQIRYEEGNVGAASCVLPMCVLYGRQPAACISHAHTCCKPICVYTCCVFVRVYLRVLSVYVYICVLCMHVMLYQSVETCRRWQKQHVCSQPCACAMVTCVFVLLLRLLLHHTR